MSNMSYCRFENTSNDLGDCVNEMQDANSGQQLTEDMSSYERAAVRELYELCQQYVEEYQRLFDEE